MTSVSQHLDDVAGMQGISNPERKGFYLEITGKKPLTGGKYEANILPNNNFCLLDKTIKKIIFVIKVISKLITWNVD